MLEPSSRRLLMESLQPPDGSRLDWAVGTTYTLDLMALLTAPVAFAFSDWQDRDGRPTGDPLALLKAVRQYASQICLFHQAGKIHVPQTYQPLLASLEESVVSANAPQGGSFHPKMWFLRFVDVEEETVQYRVLCVSRNMTFDRSWDTLLCLEGPLRDRANAFSKNHPLGQFVESLPGMSNRPLAPQWKKRIEQLAQDIRRVEFEELRQKLDDLGLKGISTHIGTGSFKPTELQKTIDFHQIIGCKYLIVPGDGDFTDPEKSLKLAETFNKTAEVLKPLGMACGYHNHTKEFTKFGDSTYWDLFAARTTDDVVLEQDCGWSAAAGLQPAEVMKAFPGRTRLVHFKPTVLKGDKDKKAIIGEDSVDWVATLEGCRTVGGTEWIFVEQEVYPDGKTPMECTELSLAGLKKIL